MTDTFTIRWGIMATGGIARTFIRNLLQYPPEARGTTNIIHTITGIASSSSLGTAKSFIDTNVDPYQSSIQCTAYPSYLALAQSHEVDVIYIAAPHSMHFRTAALCLEQNKPILCEKPLCVTAAQAEKLISLARSRGLFMMEAVWTRFFPLCTFVRNTIQQGIIGEILRINIDFSLSAGDEDGVKEMFGDDYLNSRMLSKELAGGVLLDLGIYGLNWVMQCVYHTLPPSLRQPPILSGHIVTPHPITAVDESITLLLSLPSTPTARSTCHCTVSTSLHCTTDPATSSPSNSSSAPSPPSPEYALPFLRLQASAGEIHVFGNAARPQYCRIIAKSPHAPLTPPSRVSLQSSEQAGGQTVYRFDSPHPGDGNGMYYEADEVARCIRNGRVESDVMPWEESLMCLRIMDEVRRKAGLRFPEDVESADL